MLTSVVPQTTRASKVTIGQETTKPEEEMLKKRPHINIHGRRIKISIFLW